MWFIHTAGSHSLRPVGSYGVAIVLHVYMQPDSPLLTATPRSAAAGSAQRACSDPPLSPLVETRHQIPRGRGTATAREVSRGVRGMQRSELDKNVVSAVAHRCNSPEV